MTEERHEVVAKNVDVEREGLFAAARAAHAGRAAATLYRGDALHQTMIALLSGAQLADHESPPEAVLQMIAGRILLRGDGRDWELSAGDLIPIPPERHAVTAVEDSVFLLSVVRDTAPAEGASKGSSEGAVS